MYAIFNLVSNAIMTGFAFIGIGTVIIKTGKFFKIIEQNKEDGFKLGFDKIMLESIDEMNTCVESISVITNNFSKIFFILYDIAVGNKYIKKDKDGKIILCNKSKLYSGFQSKIDELNSKVKKYQQELNKVKNKKKSNNKLNDDLLKSDFSDDSSDDSISIDLSIDEDIDEKNKEIYDYISSDEESNDDTIKINKTSKKNTNDEFYLD
jgi:hypothetical protein